MPQPTVSRPYSQLGIIKLEALYAQSGEDEELIAAIWTELQHRNTERAKRLQHRITVEFAEQLLSWHAEPTNTSAIRVDSTLAPPPSQPSAPTVGPGISDDETRARLDALETSLSTSASEQKDDASAILSTWISLEVLSPQGYSNPVKIAGDDQRCIVQIGRGPLPWQRGEASRNNFRLYYLVVFGEVDLDAMTADLLSTFGNDEEAPARREGQKAPIAAVIVDKKGMLQGMECVAISSFAWGAPVVLRGHLGALGRWPEAESVLQAQLHHRLQRVDEDGNTVALDLEVIHDTHDWLVQMLGLNPQQVHAPSFAVRLYQYYRNAGAPDMPLLNSFYINDLVKARGLVNGSVAPEALARYLSIVKPAPSSNLLQDKPRIAELVAPARFPPACWPSPAGRPLVTLQQAAVNAVRCEFASGKEGILAINGPPGTGKTTLLRDLVAHCVSSRAAALIKFDDPQEAFKASGQKLSLGNGAFLHMYKLDPTLKGFELLVASSNNKAVENVSKELPAGKSVEPGPQYFRSVAQAVYGNSQRDGSGPDDAETEDAPWGLIAAVLGNGSNRAAFKKKFWWDQSWGFLTYLKAARGEDVRIDMPATESEPARKEIPAVVLAEQPLSGPAALQHWKKVRGEFKRLQSEIESKLAELEVARALPGKVVRAQAAATQRQRALEQAIEVHAAVHHQHERAEQEVRACKEANSHCALSLQALLAGKPGFFTRLFRTQSFRHWDEQRTRMSDEHAEASRKAAVAQSAVTASAQQLAEATHEQAAARNQAGNAQATLDALQVHLSQAREQIGDRFVDEAFFARGHDSWNLASPWLDAALHQLRARLFALGLEVHRAFVTVAAQKMQHNLGVLMNAMQAGAFDVAEKRALLPDLWSSLFLVIPVISTTFASVDRMLGDVPEGAFGWLLVDEAGQATPQATVGALLRAKRVVVVGDPLQIPPVVSIPPTLISEIAKDFEVERNVWCAPEASVQTLSDAATHTRAEFSAGVGVREVGMPLLVHRRCQEPMFGVSNTIAYDGQMVYAAGRDRPDPIGKALGESGWLDVNGAATTKWSAQEGQAVLHLLRTIAHAGIRNPDVYVISPFRVVAQEMRQLLRSEPELFAAFGVQTHQFLAERVGTIHTFQGKEAEAVIAVLGAPLESQRGARQWAAFEPNILNVMVSRAKSRLYVVGSHGAWSGTGHFAELAKRVRKRTL